MADPALKHLFKEVQTALREEDYSAALAAANKVLAKDGKEKDALVAKAVSLIYLGKYQEALDLIKSKMPEGLSFAKAYALYRLNRTSEALEALSGEDEATLYLRAQALFRLQRYTEAAHTYGTLVREVDAAAVEDPELMTNLYAAYTVAGRAGDALKEFPVDEALLEECWELGANLAGALTEVGDLQAAQDKAQEARETCTRLAGEDGEEEKRLLQETAVLDLQLAYLSAVRGRRAEAEQRFRALAKIKLEDGVAHAVALNNALALTGEKDTAGAYKRLRAALSVDSTGSKLLPAQALTLALNKAVLALRSSKVKEAVSDLEGVAPHFKDHWSVALVQLSLGLKDGSLTEQQADDKLKSLLSSVRESEDEEGERRVALTLAHRLAAQGKLKEAISMVESVKSIQGRPGTVSTLVAMYEKLGDSQAALRTLDAALALPDLDEECRAKILRGAALHRAKARQHREAAQAYQSLLDLGVLEGEERVAALAALVSETSWFDADEAERLASSLPVSTLFDKVGEMVPDEVEEAGLPRTIRTRVQADKAQNKESKKRVTDKAQRLKRRAKLREKYLQGLIAKGKYDPKHPPPPPDPERWIPKSQRSYNRRGRKGRTKFTGAQGSGDGAQKDAAKLDVAARVAAEESKKKEETSGGGVKPPAGVGKRRGKK